MKKIILATICALGIIPAVGNTAYKSSSDTGTEIFDYLENRRRAARTDLWSEDQLELKADIEEAKSRLPQSLEEGAPVPVAFEGDDLIFNAVTGEFIAKGRVDIIQLEGYRFQSTEASGNVNENEVRVKGKSHMIQINENAPRVTLDGYNTFYNYAKKTGTMERVKGKVGDYYIAGKRFEFYPDHIVAYDAYQTKCGARNPDYRVSAKRMEIYPEQIIRMYDVGLWIGDFLVGTQKYNERKLDGAEETYFPRFGYSSNHGFYVRDTFTFPLKNSHYQAILNAHIETKRGIRSSGEFHYLNKDFTARTLYGFYYDSDGRWIKKEPSLDLYYSKKIEGSPLTYTAEYEIGDWSADNAASTHQEFEIGVSHDPIVLWEKYNLMLHSSYKIMKDDIKHSNSGLTGNRHLNGFNYNATLFREFDENFAAYTSYEHNRSTSKNSLYDYDNDDYSTKFALGASYRLTDKDRFVAGLKFDAKKGTLEDADYYWYRDLHCSTAIFRWRQKRDKVEVHWQFTPW